MSILEGLLIFFTVLFLYFVIVLILHKKGILEKLNISFYGPALLLRTVKAKHLLEKIAKPKRFWKSFGSFAVVFCFIAMIWGTFTIMEWGMEDKTLWETLKEQYEWFKTKKLK